MNSRPPCRSPLPLTYGDIPSMHHSCCCICIESPSSRSANASRLNGRLWVVLVLGLALVDEPRAAAQAPPSKGPVSFINQVAPILKENCFACHDSKKRKGKLDMTTYERFRTGGTKDDPVVPGKPEESVIIDLLTAKGSTRMPPKEAGEALPKE